jgi:glycosyltransferase involved in cell wall biosynthesis
MSLQHVPSLGRIAIFISDLRGGGAERNMVNLANGFTALGWQVDMVLARKEGDYLNKLPEGARVIDLGAKKTIFTARKLAHYLDSERPKALLSALDTPNLVAIWAKRRAKYKPPIVISIRNHMSVELGTSKDKLTKFVMPMLMRRYFPLADGITCVSFGAADDAAKFLSIPRERIQAIWNPVITPNLLKQMREPLDHPWFKPGEPPVILGLGRLAYQKNFPMLINAFAKVRKVMNTRLLILGEGEDRSALEQQVRDLKLEDSVSLPGFADNPFRYLREARVFALSSHYEGLPTALIESLGAGTPVVSTDCPSGPDEILEGGKYGALVPVDDADAFATALLDELGKPKQTPPEASWRRFDRDEIAKSYLRVLVGNEAEG